MDQIEVAGNKKNSREDILKYLGIKVGDLMTRERALELKYRLWLSGRFTKHEVMLTPPSRYSQCRLQIEVVEYEKRSTG